LAIGAMLATSMIWDRELDIRRFANIKQGDQAMEYALGAEAWAEQILLRDFQKHGELINMNQSWATQLPPLPIEGGTLSGHLQDLQGLFNINNLAAANAAQSSAALAQFQRLLIGLNLDPGIANAVTDWVNAGDQPHYPGGAKDEFYSQLAPPYLAAEQPMTDVSELLLVKGVTPQVYAALLPYVCALPLHAPDAAPGAPGQPTSVNINTAPAPVLASLSEGISQGAAAAAVQARQQQVFVSVGELQNLLQRTLAVGLKPGLASSYFLLTVRVQIGSTEFTLYSLLYRASNGTTIAIRRTFGIL
ncbi:MAG: type II secretion system minor pseudopilin GspK, partial [Gammaproteobacteria bacterium]|nr:type II secretion system minor pseudopilin GspK [Gammaproteobacteria bacterium]